MMKYYKKESKLGAVFIEQVYGMVVIYLIMGKRLALDHDRVNEKKVSLQIKGTIPTIY